MLKRLILLLALVPAPALAAPWQLQPDTSVIVDVGWEGKTVQVRFPTLSGQVDFDKDHPDRARATISVAAFCTKPYFPITSMIEVATVKIAHQRNSSYMNF